MIELGAHAEFIIWGYAGVAVATLALCGWVWMQSRGAAARLKALEARGIRRRSDGASS